MPSAEQQSTQRATASQAQVHRVQRAGLRAPKTKTRYIRNTVLLIKVRKVRLYAASRVHGKELDFNLCIQIIAFEAAAVPPACFRVA